AFSPTSFCRPQLGELGADLGNCVLQLSRLPKCKNTLGGIVGKIRAAGAAHPLHPIDDDLDKLNLYCRRYHHGENPNAATEPIDDAELQGYVKRTLSLVGCLL